MEKEKEKKRERELLILCSCSHCPSPSSQLGSEAKGSLGKSSPRLEPAAPAVAATASL